MLTWLPHRSWRHGVSAAAAHAWLLAEGVRDVQATRTGFYLSHSDCSGRQEADQAPGLAIDHRGRLRVARLSAAVGLPRQGAIWTRCAPSQRGRCQFDPRTNTLSRLRRPYAWDGTWRGSRTILWRRSGHISGTWSADGGRTWNQFADPWDATPLRHGGALVAVSHAFMGRGRSFLGELTGGSMRAGYREWNPEDAAPRTPLPGEGDGYRMWSTTPDGTLVGIGRHHLYVSAGENWSEFTRRESPCGQAVTAVGGYLTCGAQGPPYPLRGSPPEHDVQISEDLGATWTTIALDAVVP